MKRTKFVAMILIFALVTISISYAAWTDGLNSRSEILTGNLNVEIVKDSYNGNYKLLEYQCHDIKDKKYNSSEYYGLNEVDIDFIESKNGIKDISFKFFEIIPGTKTVARVSITNTGSMPVAIKDMEIILDGDSELVNNMKMRVIVRKDSNLIFNTDFRSLNNNGYTYNQLLTDMLESGEAVNIGCNQTIKIIVFHYFDEESTVAQDMDIQSTLKINFIQKNLLND